MNNNELYAYSFIPNGKSAQINLFTQSKDGELLDHGFIPIRDLVDGAHLQRILPKYLKLSFENVTVLPKRLETSGRNAADFDTAIVEFGSNHMSVEERMLRLERRESKRLAETVRREDALRHELELLRSYEREPTEETPPVAESSPVSESSPVAESSPVVETPAASSA